MADDGLCYSLCLRFQGEATLDNLSVEDLALLVIEPSTTQAKIIVDRLRSQGVNKIELTHNGQEALQWLEHYVPDLIVSSMYLPDMTAVKLLTQLRENPKFNTLPFMLVSSETRVQELDPIRQAGVVGILPKPFDNQDLERALKTTLQYLEPQELELDNYDIEELRVLLVDDSRLARRHIQRVLNDMGIINITEAEDGKKAAEIMERETFDLVITDYNMPVMDGKALTDFIRNQLNNPYMPIIMVTSEQNNTQLAAVQQAGVSAICDKPFEPGFVKSLLYRCLET